MHVIAFIYVKATNRKYVSIDNIFAVTDTAVKVSKQEILSQIVFVETFLEDIVTFLVGTTHQGRDSIISNSNIRKHTIVRWQCLIVIIYFYFPYYNPRKNYSIN